MKLLCLFFLSLFITAITAKAQECNCPESFSWMVDTFEKNDAGFQVVIDKKGEEDYKKHTNLFKEKAASALTINECHEVLYTWLKYFRPGHIGVSVKQNDEKNEEYSEEAIRLRYKNEKTINLTEKQLLNILKNRRQKNPIEGIWTDGNYTIGIVGDKNSNKKFFGFIIKADNVYWMPKQIKAEFTLDDDNKTYSAVYYMQNHSKEAVKAYLLNDLGNVLVLYGNYWKRLFPQNSLTKNEEILLSFSKSRTPFVEKINDNTVYLRVPSFSASQKQTIDSVLAQNDDLIKTTPNLIIDIRNGTGGSDASYEKIIPYLYTNPIRSVNVELFATELNAVAFENYSKQYDDTVNINYCLRVADKMRKNIGKFITVSDQIYHIDTLPAVLPYPQKVAIICNQNNGSTDEQFLLAAKQSRKVKVFGRPTGGMLDISNMNRVEAPDGIFGLGYCMSRSFRIPNYTIDGVGIQPDHFIDDAIAEENWIDYTLSVLGQ